MNDIEFGKRVAFLRRQSGLTQAEIAYKLGVSYSGYQRYEAGGMPNQRNIKRICDFFECNKTWLLTGEGEMMSKSASSVCSDESLTYTHEIVHDNLGDGVILLTRIHAAENKSHYDNTIKYLKHTADIIDIEERTDSDRKQ